MGGEILSIWKSHDIRAWAVQLDKFGLNFRHMITLLIIRSHLRRWGNARSKSNIWQPYVNINFFFLNLRSSVRDFGVGSIPQASPITLYNYMLSLVTRKFFAPLSLIHFNVLQL